MSIKSADRTLLILEAVAKMQPVAMPALREQLGVPRSSLHGLLQVMTHAGFLSVNGSGEYSIGLKAFEVGSTWARSVSIESVAPPIVTRLVDEVKQIAHVGVLDGTDVVYILKRENARPVRLVSAVGRRLPAYATALGKVLLSALPRDDIEARFAGIELPRLTPATVTSLDALIDMVEASGRVGVGIDRGESTPGVTCYAAPIFERGHEMSAALSISVIDSDPEARDEATYIAAVKRAAADISAALGDGTAG